MHTGTDLLTDKQNTRLDAVYASEKYIEVKATWAIYQGIVAAYREPDKKKGAEIMKTVINAVTAAVPSALVEVRRLGRTLK